MSKNLLIVGKDSASVSDFAEAMTLGDFNVATADDAQKRTTSAASVTSVMWNKSSAVSARSLIIQAETTLGYIDDYIFYFDSPLYAAEYSSFSAENCQKSADEMITSFQYVALEALTRIEQKKSPARLIFILKPHPSAKDFVLFPGTKNLTSIPANPFVAASESAFANFAENLAALQTEKENISVLLVTGDNQNETIQKTSALASWLSATIITQDNQKSKPSPKAALTWIKAGSKTSGAFSLFH
ncbi:MAG: hypothetical protein II367_01270 [Treponema sp.]|nr:hypothetical protein [Treponema sp.]